MTEKHEDSTGITFFTVEQDAKGWKAVVTRDKNVVKESYALNHSDAQQVRTAFVNEFWGNRLN